MNNLIIDAASDKIFFTIMADNKSYTSEFINNRENFDKLTILIVKFLENHELNIKNIDNIYSLKTGRLIECSVMLGQINNNDDKIKKILYSFGKKIGLAFQITDDILEATSDQNTLGKNNNSDLKNNKSTYIKVTGLKEAKSKSHELSFSAIKSLDELKMTETNMLIELAKYISYREK